MTLQINQWYELNMTSNTTPTPYSVNASAEATGTAQLSWKAFSELTDESKSNDNWMVATNIRTGWIRLNFGNNTKVNKVKIKAPNNSADYNSPPYSFTIEGGSDGVSFETLYTATAVTWSYNEEKVFEFDTRNYKFYRINVSSAYRISTGAVNSGTLSIRRITFGYNGEPDINHLLFLNDNKYKKWDTITSSWKEIGNGVLVEDNYIQGNTVAEVMALTSDNWKALSGEVFLYSFNNFDIDSLVVTEEVDPFSVYEYISELPEVLVYTESTEDIAVSTTVEPFDIYEEFGDSVEALFYTENMDTTSADLILEANWSPIDELEDDFEVVTWTDEPQDTAQRVLEMKAVPKPQFVKLVNPKRLYGELENVFVEDISSTFRKHKDTRYFVGGVASNNWSIWDKNLNRFTIVDASTEQAIIDNGMSYEDLNNITDAQWRTWTGKYLNIGIFLRDNIRDTAVSVVETITYKDILPRFTSTIEGADLYILNTTAKIDIAFNGNVLKGILSDDDLTRVQYRVLVNNNYFYPSDGNFTKLGESPQNIEVAVSSRDIKIDDWNTIKIEFQDFYGTTDYWQTTFVGTYTGLMFKDIFGQYYSSEIGEILQYLDFGVIIAGQTTIEHEIVLKNQYGYDVKNIYLSANTSNFPQGMECEFSASQSPFTPQPELRLNGVLRNNEEMSFFIRLKTELGATPDVNGSFDIIVRADEV